MPNRVECSKIAMHCYECIHKVKEDYVRAIPSWMQVNVMIQDLRFSQ